jgi:hypothetical protein
MENLRNSLQNILRNTEQPDTDLDDAKWSQMQDEFKLVYQDQPDLLGKTQFTGQQFDPSARVRLLPGLDGQPGTADFDDNVNGVIDDAGELGATFSDDLCVVEASQAPANPIEPSIVLQHGAYVAADRRFTQPTRHPDRILVLYQTQQGVDQTQHVASRADRPHTWVITLECVTATGIGHFAWHVIHVPGERRS